MEDFIVLFGHKSFKKILHKNKAVDNADEEMLNKGGWKCQLHSEISLETWSKKKVYLKNHFQLQFKTLFQQIYN